MNECEKFLANLFTGKDDMRFSDVTDDDPKDVMTGMDETPQVDSEGKFQSHNHLYNPSTDPGRSTEIFAPAGGVVTASGTRPSAGGADQRYTNVYYPSTDTTLQFWHVEGAQVTSTASTKPISLGTISKDGSWVYLVDGKRVAGLHMHLNAYTGKLGKKFLTTAQKKKRLLKLSSLCPSE